MLYKTKALYLVVVTQYSLFICSLFISSTKFRLITDISTCFNNIESVVLLS